MYQLFKIWLTFFFFFLDKKSDTIDRTPVFPFNSIVLVSITR